MTGRGRRVLFVYVCVVTDRRTGGWEGQGAGLLCPCLFGGRAEQELLDVLLHPPLELAPTLGSVCHSAAGIKALSVLSCLPSFLPSPSHILFHTHTVIHSPAPNLIHEYQKCATTLIPTTLNAAAR